MDAGDSYESYRVPLVISALSLCQSSSYILIRHICAVVFAEPRDERATLVGAAQLIMLGWLASLDTGRPVHSRPAAGVMLNSVTADDSSAPPGAPCSMKTVQEGSVCTGEFDQV